MKIIELMTLVAAFAIVVRAVMETPRIVRHWSYTRAAAQSARDAKDATAWGASGLASSYRDFSEIYLANARLNQPDPVGHICYIITLAGGALIILASLVILIRRKFQKRLVPSRDPSPTAD